MSDDPFNTPEPSAGEQTPAESTAGGINTPEIIDAEFAMRPPRVWTVFVTFIVSFVAVIGIQILVGIGLAVYFIAAGTVPQDLATALSAWMLTPFGFCLLIASSQPTMALTSLGAAWFSPVPTGRRLGLTRPALPVWLWPVLLIGTCVPAALAIISAAVIHEALGLQSNLEQLYRGLDWNNVVLFVGLIALAPGFCEELLFRGYIQTRLVERWSVWVGIMVTSIMFAVMHIEPHAMGLAFILGLWFGFVAWRSASIWPTIVLHAWVNGAWNILQVSALWNNIELEDLNTTWLVVAGAVSVACFLASIWALFRIARPICLASPEVQDNTPTVNPGNAIDKPS